MDRGKIIVKTSVIGIIINAVLVSIKVIIGLASGSIAIILDAVNNLSDALTSLITIIGTRLASRAPDRKHPYGYGRIEYITTVVISFVILIAGGTAFKESVEAIVNKDVATYELTTIIILVCAVFVKFFIAFYTKKMGRLIDSHALIASGQEAFFDGIMSIGTLGAAATSLFFGLSIEGWLGILISIGIIRAGGEMLGETISTIIGVRQDKELTSKLKDFVAKYPGVVGVYDVILHNYGPSQHIGTIHIEVDEDMTAKAIHILTSNIVDDVCSELDIILTVGIYSSVKSDPVALHMRSEVTRICHRYPEIMQVHGFYLDSDTIGLDLVIDFKADAPGIIAKVRKDLEEAYPQYKYRILLDLDFSD